MGIRAEEGVAVGGGWNKGSIRYTLMFLSGEMKRMKV